MEQGGHEFTLREIADNLSAILLRYLERYVGDRATAEDLLQETLIRIDRGLPNFAAKSSLKTWAFSIATNVALDHVRRPEQRLRLVELDEALELPDGDLPVGERLVQEQMSDCMRHLIDALPENYRVALILHDLEGMTAEQTADICGCSVANAKIRVHRARSRLKDALRQACQFYRDRDHVFRCERKGQDAVPVRFSR